VHPWFNFILRPVFSLPKPAQVTSVVLFNIGPVTPNRINGLFDSVKETEPHPYLLPLSPPSDQNLKFRSLRHVPPRLFLEALVFFAFTPR
jgi:hypothetical protein